MIFRVCLGRIQELTWNLEHLVYVTCRGTCRKCDFKLYKIQTKSENHETCRCIVLSHVEVVVKNWEGFEQVVTSNAKNRDVWVFGIRRHNLLETLSGKGIWAERQELGREMDEHAAESTRERRRFHDSVMSSLQMFPPLPSRPSSLTQQGLKARYRQAEAHAHFLLGTMKDQVVAVAPMPVRYRPIIILLLSADHTLLLARLITSYRKSGIQVDLIPGHMTYQHSAVTVTVQVVVLAWRQVKKERLWQRREHNDRKPPQRWPSSVLHVQHHSWISYAVASSLYIFALFQQYQTMHIYSYVRTS